MRARLPLGGPTGWARCLGRRPLGRLALLLGASSLLLWPASARAGSTASRQRNLNEWRNLTAPNGPQPRVFVKGEAVRFYFPSDGGVEAFKANWSRVRVPTEGYRVNSALLSWDQKLSAVPAAEQGWHEARVIAGSAWRHLATNLVTALTPLSPGHGAYYQAFLADGLLYRDLKGVAHFTALAEQPQGILIDRRFSVDETLQLLAHLGAEQLARSHPGDSLFLLMAPNAERVAHPLLLNRKLRQCVWLEPAALYDTSEQGFNLTVTAQGLSALLLEGHGLALLKNPLSSAARLGDLTVQSGVRFLRFPLPKPSSQVPTLAAQRPGMDLAAWESWLDHYTGTRREDGTMSLLIDGDQFFPRLQAGIAAATNHLHFNIYIFDRDDIAVEVANQLKQRAQEIDVKVVLDRLGSIGAGMAPPSSPMPTDFTPPSSICSYLREGSQVRVRPFLNPWLSSDHTKVLLVDGQRAWLGGMNFGREYRYEWHDMMVEVSGPIVRSLETDFERKWAHAGPWGDVAYLATLFKGPQPVAPAQPSADWMRLRRLPTKTAWKPYAAAVLGSLRRAQNFIYLENPYLFDKRVILALVRARGRGVDVRVILPRLNDFKAGGRGNLVVANYLFEHGVRVYFYPAMTHVKALMVDDWSCVGSGNLNHLSLRVNQEQNIASSDPRLASHLKQELFEADFARSYELSEPISVDWMDFLADLLLEGF